MRTRAGIRGIIMMRTYTRLLLPSANTTLRYYIILVPLQHAASVYERVQRRSRESHARVIKSILLNAGCKKRRKKIKHFSIQTLIAKSLHCYPYYKYRMRLNKDLPSKIHALHRHTFSVHPVQDARVLNAS